MEHDWTFEATDIVCGRQQIIDQNWPRSDAAKNPDNGYPGNYCGDEHIVQTPAGDYVLVWRADQYRHYHECKRMPEREARDWCERQGIAWPEEFSDATPMTAAQPPANEHRTLWELGQRIAPALDALCSAIADLFVEYESPFSGADIVFQGVDGDKGSKVRAAVVELHARMPRENDPFREWEIVAPRGTQDFVDVVSGIDALVKGIVADVAFDRAKNDAYWQRALKLAYARCDVLLKAIVQLESLPELHPHVLTEALRKLQAPAPATAAIPQRESANAQLTPDDEEELELLFPTVNAKPENDVTTETAVVAGDGVAVVAKPEGKVAVEAATLQMVAGRVPVAPPNDFELSAMWAPSQLAERFGLSGGALTKALQRWRGKNGDGWHEVENRKPREPKYTYRLSAVMPLINGMLAASSEQGASSEMSA